MRVLIENERDIERLRNELDTFFRHWLLPVSERFVENAIDGIRRNRHGLIRVVYGFSSVEIRWATVKGEKRLDYDLMYRGTNHPVLEERFILPENPRWRKEREDVFGILAPEILMRYKRFRARRLVGCWSLDLRLREGKERWGEPVSGYRLVDSDDSLRMITVTADERTYLVTGAGAFPTERESVRFALEELFGINTRKYKKIESIYREIERQVELKEEARGVLGFVPGYRIREVDPRYGVIAGKYFYPAGRKTRIWLEPEHRSIKRLMFGLYGHEIPEFPDVASDYEAPPWTLRRFGEKRRAYLVDEDPARGLYVFLEYGRFYLGFERKTFRIAKTKKRPDVASAFRSVFGMELTPEMTREDVEAIVAMLSLR